MKSRVTKEQAGRLLRRSIVASALFCLLLSVDPVQAQDPPVVRQPSAPPPAKVISKEERARIETAKDDKARLKTTLELAETHLTQAEANTKHEEFEPASSALGKYQALIQNALDSIAKLPGDSNKTRDLYKRLELTLRAHGPRLITIRRSTPLEYAVWIKELEEFTRKGRTDALNSFYGTTVIKEPQSKVADEKRSKNPKNAEPNPNPED
jgi:hypothetical protein